MIPIVALVIAIIALLGLILHSVLADAPNGVAHRMSTINDWLVEKIPSMFSPNRAEVATSEILPTPPPGVTLLTPTATAMGLR